MSKSIQGSTFTPRELVHELDRFIVGQAKAKRAVAIALRNRWRRQQLPTELAEEIAPKNIIMAGPTGVGKTEIARRLAKLSRAPFVKVEATKFTEVGYVGRDVDSMVRDLVEVSIKLVKEAEQEANFARAQKAAEERLLDVLLPPSPQRPAYEQPAEVPETSATRERLREMLRDGKLDERTVEIDVLDRGSNPVVEVLSNSGMEEMDINFQSLFGNMFPKKRKTRRVTVPEAMTLLQSEEAEKLLDMDAIVKEAVRRAEQTGIIFIDEIDKVAGKDGSRGPDVSRQGVQRDILPIVEGSSVNTKRGMVRTDHVLFIAAGAFHVSKPSDLIPELQGRFPIRVELDALGRDDFVRILTEPQNALTRQYVEMLGTEGVKLAFTEDGIAAMAEIAAEANRVMENIGARRLHTILELVLDELSFDAPERSGAQIEIDAAWVHGRLEGVLENEDLSKYVI